MPARTTPDPDYGIGDALARGDWESAATIVERWNVEFFSSAIYDRYVEVVAHAPDDVHERHPLLTYSAEVIHLREPSKELPVFDLERLKAGGEPGLVELRRIIAAVTARRVRGLVADSVAIAETVTPAVLEAVRRRSDLPATSASLFFLQVGLTYELAGDEVASRRTHLLGWQFRSVASPDFVVRDLASKLAMSSARDGDNVDALRWIEEGRALPASGQSPWRFSEAVDLGFVISEFMVAVNRYDLVRINELIFRLPRPTDFAEHFHFILLARSIHLISMNRAVEALTLVDDTAIALDHLIAGEAIYRLRLDLIRARAYLALGRTDQALEILDNDAAYGDHSLVLRARAHALRFDYASALEELEDLSEKADRRKMLEATVLRAVCHFNLAQTEEARRTFAVFVAAVGDNLQVLTTVPQGAIQGLFGLLSDLPAARQLEAQWGKLGIVDSYPFAAQNLSLTDRERVLLFKLSRGDSRQLIASSEYVSINTVKKQLTRLYAKFNANSRAELLAKATSLGFLER